MCKYYCHSPTIILLVCVAGCGDAQVAHISDGAIQNRETGAGSATVDSTVLKQEMIDVTTELMQTQRPDVALAGLKGQASQFVETAIVQIRQHFPEFLIVSEETEKNLQDGNPLADANKRISEAEKSIAELGSDPPVLVMALLRQYKAGVLSPRRTELLVQLMIGAVKEQKLRETNDT